MDWTLAQTSKHHPTESGREGLLSSRRGRGLGPAALAGVLLFALAVQVPTRAEAVALNLFDPRPREIVVIFEVSPREVPAQLRTVYSQKFRAFVEPGKRESELRVVVPAHTVEEFLLGDQNPVPQSFSDFVWTFDIETGHVVSARLSGRVTPRLDWGLVSQETRADIEIDMGTARIGGFKRPLRVLGQLVFRYCTKPESSSCQLVEAVPFDRATGYVNAVGEVWVHSSIVDLWNFSPMGEAIFLEVDSAPALVSVSDLLADRQTGIELSLPVRSENLPAVSTPASVQTSSPSPGQVN